MRYVTNLKVVLFGLQDPTGLKEEIEKKLIKEIGILGILTSINIIKVIS